MSDFEMVQGDTKTIEVTVRDKAGAIVDITGATITWILSKSVKSPALNTKTVGDGITITNGAGGRFDIRIDSADTQSIEGLHYNESQVTLGSDVATVTSGNILIECGNIA